MPSTKSSAPALQILMSGLTFGESPRWHEDRLWFSDWGAHEVIAVDLEGQSEVIVRVPSFPMCIDFLPDGRLLIVSARDGLLLRREADSSLVTHADLTGLADHKWNDIVVDGRGNAYVNNVGFDFPGGEFAPGLLALVTPDGSARQVAEGVAFPNGMVVTPDNSTLIVAESFARRLTAFDIADDGGLSNRRVWADGVGPDGICMDAEGAIWTDVGEFGDNLVGRVREGRQVLERVQLDMPCFANMLGGEDGKTLFMLAADWRMSEGFDENIARLTRGPRTGQLLTAPAPAPGAGWP
jgi:sugar lactone lactonase YvrE